MGKEIEFIKKTIEDIKKFSADFEIEIETNVADDNPNGFSIFIKSPYGGYTPFLLVLSFDFINDKVLVDYCWPTTRLFIDGDKTDAYVMWPNLMGLILKLAFHESINIQYVSFFELEINRSCIYFLNHAIEIGYNDSTPIVSLFFKLIMAEICFDENIGSFSNELIRENEEASLFFKNCYPIQRKESFFETDGKRVYRFQLLNNIINTKKILNKFKYSYELLKIERGYFIKQIIADYEEIKFINNHTYQIIKRIIKIYDVVEYSILCQENMCYFIFDNNIFIISGNYGYESVEIEKYKLFIQRKEETHFFGKDDYDYVELSWHYPINAGRFEELIKDLLEKEAGLTNVRLCGSVNDRDGGKDIIYEKVFFDKNDYEKKFCIGQCKAYKKTVNKNNVIDIRDRLEQYNAKSYFLAVSERISSPLVDYLLTLKKDFSVDWWTKDEIFSKLQTSKDLIKKYKDIIDIINYS